MTHRIEQFIRYQLPVILYCLALFIQSGQSVDASLPKIPHMDKLLHMGAYAVLGALVLRAFRGEKGIIIRRHIPLSILLATLYGLSDEIHQSFVPVRQADPLDLLADFIGSTAGVLLFHRLILYFNRRTP